MGPEFGRRAILCGEYFEPSYWKLSSSDDGLTLHITSVRWRNTLGLGLFIVVSSDRSCELIRTRVDIYFFCLRPKMPSSCCTCGSRSKKSSLVMLRIGRSRVWILKSWISLILPHNTVLLFCTPAYLLRQPQPDKPYMFKNAITVESQSVRSREPHSIYLLP